MGNRVVSKVQIPEPDPLCGVHLHLDVDSF